MTTVITTRSASRGLVALLMTALLGVLLPTPAAQAAAGRDADELRAEALFVDLYNDARANPTAWYAQAAEAPQPPLEAWTDIREVARAWSDDMAAVDKLSHNPTFGDQICCWRRAGENVGVIGGVGTAQTVDKAVERLVVAFMESDGHRANIMHPSFEQMGIGVTLTDTGRLWVTVNFREVATGATPKGERYDAGATSDATTSTGPSARTIEDTCNDAERGQFSDTAGNVHEDAIDCVADRGIAQGKGDGRYDPAGELRRGHIATFLVRMLDTAGKPAPRLARDAFNDDDGTTHETSFNRLAAAGALKGNEARPNEIVTRGQMATLVIDTLRAAGVVDGEATGDWFSDDDGTAHEDDINLAAELGLVTGRGPNTFAPDATLTRAQMATFLARTLDLALAS